MLLEEYENIFPQYAIFKINPLQLWSPPNMAYFGGFRRRRFHGAQTPDGRDTMISFSCHTLDTRETRRREVGLGQH